MTRDELIPFPNEIVSLIDEIVKRDCHIADTDDSWLLKIWTTQIQEALRWYAIHNWNEAKTLNDLINSGCSNIDALRLMNLANAWKEGALK